jgi:argininosuccinate lyase
LHHNTPLGDVNDVEDPIYRPLFRLLDSAVGVYELLEAVLASGVWNVERLASRAADGFTTATELADTLVRQARLPFRAAHRVVGQLVKQALQAGRRPQDITAADVDTAAEAILGRALRLSDDAVRQALDARHFVAIRDIPGGPAPQAMAVVLERQSAQLARDKAWYGARIEELASAQRRLTEAVDATLHG